MTLRERERAIFFPRNENLANMYRVYNIFQLRNAEPDCVRSCCEKLHEHFIYLLTCLSSVELSPATEAKKTHQVISWKLVSALCSARACVCVYKYKLVEGKVDKKKRPKQHRFSRVRESLKKKKFPRIRVDLGRVTPLYSLRGVLFEKKPGKNTEKSSRVCIYVQRERERKVYTSCRTKATTPIEC